MENIKGETVDEEDTTDREKAEVGINQGRKDGDMEFGGQSKANSILKAACYDDGGLFIETVFL